MALNASAPFSVLMTADAVGGVWRYTADLISGLAQRAAKVTVATMGPRPSSPQCRELEKIPNVTLASSDYALEWIPNPWRDVDEASDWLLKLAGECKPDLIHLNGYAHAALPWKKPVVVVAHSCVCSWWRSVHACVAGPEWNEYRRRVKQGLQSASCIVSPTRAMAENLNTDYDVDYGKIQIIYNFSKSHPVRREAKQPIFLAAGRLWDQAKNIRLLESIAQALPWPIRIAGDNSASPGGAGQYLGNLNRSEMDRELSAASVFIHPALYEPFGLSVLEAARAKCCLVLSDIASLRELWDGAAVFIDPNDRDRWIRELTALANDPIRRLHMADRAFQHSKRYNASTAVRTYGRLYRDLIDSADANRDGVAA